MLEGTTDQMTTPTTRGRWSTLLALAAASFLAAMLLAYGTSPAPARAAGSIDVDTNPGAGAPPATLGTYAMTPFAPDSSPLFGNVTSVPAPGGGNLQFDRSLTHYSIGNGWGSWSHGYAGDVYSNWSASSPTRDQLVMTLPANTKAFYFYVEPNSQASYSVTATASDGTTSGPVPVDGLGGASYFGFYTTDGSNLSTITVDVDQQAQGFAIGEFAVGSTKETTPPTVTRVAPAEGASRVSPQSNVEATFSEMVDPSTVGQNTFVVSGPDGAPLSAQVSYDRVNSEATLDPSGLAPGTTYTAKVKGGEGGVKDLAGNPLGADKVWQFTTSALSDPVKVDTSPGTGAPPATLGTYAMTPFAPDSRAVAENVTGIPAPGEGTLQFDRSLTHYSIGNGWGSWSHGYAGDVYSNWSASSPTRDQLVMTLPANTKAFYFYVEPNSQASYSVTATASDGTTSGPVRTDGLGGAKYLGFYTKDGSNLSTITVNVDARAQGFAIGEFGIADHTLPKVTQVAPTARSTNVGRGTNLTATFSEKMRASTLNKSTFKLFKVNSDGTQTQITNVTVGLSSDGLKATLNPFGVQTPTLLLARNTKYKGVLTTGMKDLAGNALAQQKSWTFTTKP